MSRIRGRFAPSPSGPLHQGSLVAAVGSWLSARHQGGEWLVRIEDIDFSREVDGAAAQILSQLESHGLYWDDRVVFQSQRGERYHHWLKAFEKQEKTFFCTCSRSLLQKQGGRHLMETCQPDGGTKGIRFLNHAPCREFFDEIYGSVVDSDGLAEQDFLLLRRDGLWAYQLAVSVDDAEQGITEIVRGADLLSASFWQLTLRREMGFGPLKMMHLPVVMKNGRKLSKQNHAPALNQNQASENIWQALVFLGQAPLPELRYAPVSEILSWALQNFVPAQIARPD